MKLSKEAIDAFYAMEGGEEGALVGLQEAYDIDFAKFWKRCVVACCVVVPVTVYSEYVDGNIHQSKSQGIRFAALPFGENAVGPDYWFMIDEQQSGFDKLYATPEEALQSYEKRLTQ